jgi:eukaryotic-like serine/threonine-protein kinase
MALGLRIANAVVESAKVVNSSALLHEFKAAREGGRAVAVEDYLYRLDPADSRGAIELIYQDYCLAEARGSKPEVADYLARFPQHEAALERLILLHSACPPSLLARWIETTPSSVPPEAGDEIGPYVLKRELGRGGFARVFLAEQTDLENRLVVLKVSKTMTREPWLLARVRHAHIVEIVSHATVDDGAFHLICMPFWGGATLAALLAQRRQSGRRTCTGIDLLADLDLVAAPEFPTVHPARPAREIRAGLTYDQAIAWVGARLAEALDHAYSRDVAHGDVKPSNILLSADGNPMLLDFNLARDWSVAGMDLSKGDTGGTLAYMAPERLQGLAGDRATRDDWDKDKSSVELASVHPSSSPDRTCERSSSDLQERGPHQADIYSLGVVLLEASTGEPPAQRDVSATSAGGTDFDRLRAMAGAYASSRGRGAMLAIRESEQSSRRSITPGLRTILSRCLDPDPARRYRRGLELAEDLDRWRTDRPLAYTSEPFWRQIVPRALRRHRRTLILTMAIVSLFVALPTTAVVMLTSRKKLEVAAQHKLSRLWDDPHSPTYGLLRSGSLRPIEPGDRKGVETARLALDDYNVRGPGDWRQRDDVRFLPPADREEFELWLLEQGYRYCRALEERPEIRRDDWMRAREYISRLTASRPLQVFSALDRRLRAKLGVDPLSSPALAFGEDSRAGLDPTPSTAAPGDARWIDKYLLGVAAEWDFTTESAVQIDTQSLAQSQAAGRALGHYNAMLEIRPDSYWGNYRAAVACFALEEFDKAAGHLERCLKRRPNNPVLHGVLAGCLTELGDFRALEEANLAIQNAPDNAEWYRSRAFIRSAWRQTTGLSEDIQNFELLSNLLPRSFWGQASGAPAAGSWLRSSPQGVLDFPAALTTENRFGERAASGKATWTNLEIDQDELAARAFFASTLHAANEPALAEVEFGKIVALDPDHIDARMMRAMQSIDAGRLDEAFPDLEAILNHPGLVEHLRKEPMLLARMHGPSESLINNLHGASRRYCLRGKFDKGRTIARRVLEVATLLNRHRAASHYNLAKVHALAAPIEPSYIVNAANQLYLSFLANPLYRRDYEQDPLFDVVRAQINAQLDQKPDPSEHYHRRLAANSVSKDPSH